jgi:16S rRNA G527 N7-methylase RsmG
VAPRDFRTRLVRRASKAGLFLQEDLVARLTAYFELLSRWNRKINLTAIGCSSNQSWLRGTSLLLT